LEFRSLWNPHDNCLVIDLTPRTPRDVGTIAWKLQREIILLLAWAPAILLQLAHPSSRKVSPTTALFAWHPGAG